MVVTMTSPAVPPQLREKPPVVARLSPPGAELLLDASGVALESQAAESRPQSSRDSITALAASHSSEDTSNVLDKSSISAVASTTFETVAEHVAAIEQKLRSRGVSRTDRRALRMRLDQLRKDAALQAQQVAMLEKARRVQDEDERLMRKEAAELARQKVRGELLRAEKGKRMRGRWVSMTSFDCASGFQFVGNVG